MSTLTELIANLRDGELFTAVKSHEGEWVSCFPGALSGYSQTHATEEDAWAYIAECILEGFPDIGVPE